jgi:hypothetical protein
MIRNPLQALFNWKVRGIRWIEIMGFVCVGALVFSVYIAKAAAAREGTEIGRLERDIAETGQRVRLLRAEAARLEQPGRLEVLSRGAGLAPVTAARQANEGELTRLKSAPAPAPVVQMPPAAGPATPIVDGAPR